MTAHKHAAMIKAKADNMELVVFCKDSYDETNEWQETSQFPFQEEFNYFLCLPQHKEACLHWLNGGMVQVKNSQHVNWYDCGTYDEFPDWYANSWMMSHFNEYRIKPRKEKRWIIVDAKTNNTSFAYVSKPVAISDLEGAVSGQLIEIEVEV